MLVPLGQSGQGALETWSICCSPFWHTPSQNISWLARCLKLEFDQGDHPSIHLFTAAEFYQDKFQCFTADLHFCDWLNNESYFIHFIKHIKITLWTSQKKYWSTFPIVFRLTDWLMHRSNCLKPLCAHACVWGLQLCTIIQYDKFRHVFCLLLSSILVWGY